MQQNISIKDSEGVAKIEKWIFYFLCGYALCSSVSMGGSNVFLGLATVAAIIRLVKKHDDWRDLLTVDKWLRIPFLIFIGVLLITNIFTVNMEATAKNMFQYYINNFEPFLLAIMFVRKKDWLLKIVGLMILSISVNNLYCIYQWLLDEGNLKRVEGFFRIMSTAGLLSMTVPVLALLLLQSREKSRYICTALLIIALLGAVCNNTRGAWVAIAVTTAITSMLIVKSKLKGLAVLLVLAVGTSFAVYQIPSLHQRVESISNVTTDQSNAERLLLWESARNMAEDYPLTGVGSGNFGDLYHEKYILPQAKETYLGHAHNLFFQELAEHGYPGGIAFVIWVLGTIAYCIKGFQKGKNPGYIFLLAVFMGLMINGLTEHTFSHPIVMKWFWFASGIGYRWIKIKRNELP